MIKMKKSWFFAVFRVLVIIFLISSIGANRSSHAVNIESNAEDTSLSFSQSLLIPQIDNNKWTLNITGLVQRPLTITYDELRELPAITVFAELYFDEELITSGNWTGIELKYLLNLVDVSSAAEFMLFIGADGNAQSIPISWIRALPNLILAYEKNGEILSLYDGFPVVVVATGMEGFYWVRWVVQIRLGRDERIPGTNVVTEITSGQFLIITIPLSFILIYLSKKKKF